MLWATTVFILVYFSCLLFLVVCIVRKPAVFDLITCLSFCKEIIVAYRRTFWKSIKIDKRCQTTSWYNLFPAWECKQTWFLRNFVLTIDFTSFQFPTNEKRQYSSIFAFLCIWQYSKIFLFFRNTPKFKTEEFNNLNWHLNLLSLFSNNNKPTQAVIRLNKKWYGQPPSRLKNNVKYFC